MKGVDYDQAVTCRDTARRPCQFDALQARGSDWANVNEPERGLEPVRCTIYTLWRT